MSAAQPILDGLHSAPPPDLGASVYRSALVADKRLTVSRFAVFAVSLHAAVIAAALILPKLLSPPVPLRKPVIAKLVARGKPRPKGQLPKKQQPRPAAAAATAASVPASSSKMSAPSRRSPRAKATKPPSRQELMKRALAAAGAQAGVARARDEIPPQLSETEGLPEGSPEGTATEAQVGDKYFTAVHDAILANYILPSVISERERMYLKATLVAFIGPDGALLKHQVTRPSGNALFDQALELAVKKTKLPPPPPELHKSLRDDGVELNFKP